MTLVELLRLSSRTFALGIEQLPGALRESVGIAYLLLRVSDYLEDDATLPATEKVALLQRWDAVLGGLEPARALVAHLPEVKSDHPDALVATHVEPIFTAFQALPSEARAAILPHVRDSTRGMARWVERGPHVEDEADLDDYMHEVAGRVGYLLTELFSWHSAAIRRQRDALMPLGREFGLALQTVNIIRGMREDWRRGWNFVPRTFCERAGVTPEQLFQPQYRRQALEILDALTTKAQRHLLAAVRYTVALPPWQHRIRRFCLFPLFFAARTLALGRNDYRVFEDEVKMSRDEVRRIARDATLWGWRNGWIHRYVEDLSRAPLHDALHEALPG